MDKHDKLEKNDKTHDKAATAQKSKPKEKPEPFNPKHDDIELKQKENLQLDDDE